MKINLKVTNFNKTHQTGGASKDLFTEMKDMPLEERLGVYEHSINKLFEITDRLAEKIKERSDQLTTVATRVNLNMDDINKIKYIIEVLGRK